MSNIEFESENLNTSQDESFETGLSNLKNRVELWELENDIKWQTKLSKEKIKKKSHRDNPEYFNSKKKVETDKTYKSKGIILKRDVWMTFYVMQKSDIKYRNKKANRSDTINYLRNKLWAISEFSYLKRNEYRATDQDVTKTFNIRPDFDKYLKRHPHSYYIPIPMDSEKRKINANSFKNYAKTWIDEITKKDTPYWKYYKSIKNKQKLAAFFTAIAKVETWKTTQLIWTDEYHRRETNWHNCFSFGPHHILMEWPWKKAFNKLKSAWYFSTEWQTYHPKNSTMRCMWFIVEKLKEKWIKEKDIADKIKNMLSFLDKRKVTGNDFVNFATIYNGAGFRKNNYHNKFAQAYNSII